MPVCDSRNQFPPRVAEPVLSVDARISTPVCVVSASITYFQLLLEYRAHAIISKCVAPCSDLHHLIKSLNWVHVASSGSSTSTRETMHEDEAAFCSAASMLNIGAR